MSDLGAATPVPGLPGTGEVGNGGRASARDRPAQDQPATDRPALAAMLEARSVALVGASPRPGSLGERMVSEVTKSPARPEVYLVNPRHEQVAGRPCHASLADLPAPGDLVPLAVPGPVALITHSGSVFSAVLRTRRGLGFTIAVSSGQELVTTAAQYAEYALSLPETRVLALVLEAIREPDRLRAVLATARQRGIPVV